MKDEQPPHQRHCRGRLVACIPIELGAGTAATTERQDYNAGRQIERRASACGADVWTRLRNNDRRNASAERILGRRKTKSLRNLFQSGIRRSGGLETAVPWLVRKSRSFSRL